MRPNSVQPSGHRCDEPCCCLAQGTLVLMADGVSREIEQLQVEEYVHISDYGRAVIVNIWRGTSQDPLWCIQCGESSITATKTYPLMTEGGWQRLSELAVGDLLLLEDGQYQAVGGISSVKPTDAVYSLELAAPSSGIICNGFVVGDFHQQNGV